MLLFKIARTHMLPLVCLPKQLLETSWEPEHWQETVTESSVTSYDSWIITHNDRWKGILSEREGIASELLHILDVATDPWGITVERVEVKDVRLPVSLQRAMAAEAEAAREAKAKVGSF